MLACIGYIVPEYFRWPGMLSPSEGISFTDVPNGLGALAKVPVAGWAQIFAFAGAVELGLFKPTGEPGNYGQGFLGALGILGSIQETGLRKKKLGAEISNGRLAMFAIIGMFFQDGLTGSAWGDWALFEASPLRSGIKSPGWNPLPDFDVPPNGFEGNVGDQPPLGFWDPLGYTADGDFNKFQRRREVEIKHGRVSMLACIGYIVPEYFRWPGMLSPSEGISFTDVPNGLGALAKVPVAGWAQIFAFAGAVELGLFKPTGEPGNYGQGFLGALGILGSIQETGLRKKKLGAEISNGRLAMFAIIGMFFQDGLTGSAWGDWALFEASPLRAFENELGVQPPVGFWDPLGFTRNGDELAYKRRRVTELKHGRVCMLATLGYIVPETLGKFRGELSPSLGLKFSDIPNGLAAISKVPAIGWVQIIAFAGCVEGAWSFNEDYSGTPGDYGWKAITSVDEEIRTRKLSAEIANGRLAMMAIIGMFFQDGLTGQAWGDWSLYTESPLRS